MILGSWQFSARRTQQLVRALSKLRHWQKFAAIALMLIVSVWWVFDARALVSNVTPNGDVTAGWAVTGGTSDATCAGGTHCDFVDEGATQNTADYVGTGTGGSTGEVEEFTLETISNTDTVSQVKVYIYAWSATFANGGELDTVDINLRVGGTLQTATTVTPLFNGGAWYSATFTGSWTQTQLDGMQAHLTRIRQGSGSPASQDDDVRVASVYAEVTYTQILQFEQSAYRWFANQDASGTGLTHASAYGGTGGDFPYDVSRASDGGFAIAGATSSFGAGSNDVILTKYDESGRNQWTRYSGGTGSDVGYSSTTTTDGSYVVAGLTASFGTGNDMFILKYSADGTKQWVRNWGGSGIDAAFGVAPASDGGVVMTGRTASFGAGSEDVLLVKYSSSGTLVWERTWGSANGDIGRAIIATSDGGYAVVGDTSQDGISANGFLTKFDSTGSVSWARTWGDSGADAAHGLVATNDGGYVITGQTTSYGAGADDAFVAKYDSSGTLQWSRTWGGTGVDIGRGVTQASNGNVLVTGDTASYGTAGDTFVAEFDSSGALLSSRTFGGSGAEIGRKINAVSGGGYEVMSQTASYGAGSNDFLYTRYDTNGSVAGCSSPMCQTHTVTAGSPSATTSSPSISSVAVSGSTSATPSDSAGQTTITTTSVVAASGLVDVSSPMAAQDTAATATSTGIYRLRLNLHVLTGQADPGVNSLKLQYVGKGTGTCASPSGGTPASYTDVTTTTSIAYANNTLAVDGQGLASNANDPVHSGHTVVRQSYEEVGDVPTASAVSAGQDGQWDFALKDNGAASSATYCFRLTKSDGAVLNTYSIYPELTVTPPELTQANYRWFNNADSTAPGSVLAAQDTAASLAAETPFRLRGRIAVDGGFLGQSGQNLKLQYAEKSGVCDVGFSGETYQDIVAVNSSSARSAAATSNDASYGTTAWASTGMGGDVIGGPSTSYSQYLKSSSHGFSIPASATIDGIEVKITGYSSGFGVAEDRMRLVKGGVIGSVNRASTGWTNGQVQTYTYGGAADLWGETWAPANINASSFGVAMSAYLEADSGEGSSLFVTDMNIKVYYSTPPGAVGYYDNASVADAVTISSTGNDPTNASRPTVLQNYREDTPFTNGAATVPVGSDGLWDFALTSSSAANGKTYCLRFVKSDDSPLDTYSQIPEITIGSGPVGPTLDQMTRGGQSVVNGVKNPFSF